MIMGKYRREMEELDDSRCKDSCDNLLVYRYYCWRSEQQWLDRG